MNRWLFDNDVKNRLSRHMLFFLLTVLGFAAVLFLRSDNENFLTLFRLTFINALFFFGYAYITIFLLIPQFLLKRDSLWFIVLFLLIGIAFSTLKLVFSDFIFYSSISPENMNSRGIMNLRYIMVNTKDMTFIVALFCVFKYAKDYLYVENIRKNLEIQNKKAQEKLLQTQLNPHFLFNTINNLYALSLLNPEKSLEVIYKIKQVLKYIIDKSQHELVEFSDEIILVENYILLEKLRYGKRLKVKFTKEGNLQQQKIPPMVLFFLVENCFKHGSSPDTGAPWIEIQVTANENMVSISTKNSVPKKNAAVIKTDSTKKENGIKNLEKRLNMVYSKNGFILKTKEEKNIYSVELELKTNYIGPIREKYR